MVEEDLIDSNKYKNIREIKIKQLKFQQKVEFN